MIGRADIRSCCSVTRAVLHCGVETRHAVRRGRRHAYYSAARRRSRIDQIPGPHKFSPNTGSKEVRVDLRVLGLGTPNEIPVATVFAGVAISSVAVVVVVVVVVVVATTCRLAVGLNSIFRDSRYPWVPVESHRATMV